MTPVEIFVPFVIASTILLFMPGPTVLLVVSYAMTHGRRSAFSTIAGVMLGDAVAMALSLLGLGAILMTSAGLFLAMKVAGALYLVYLGVKMWRAPAVFEEEATAPQPASSWSMALDAFTVTVLNPKSGMFFVAFMPQFMNAAEPLVPQTLLLGTTFLVIAFASVTIYALLASEIRRAVQSPAVSKAVNRIGGAVLVSAGVLTAAMRRT